MGYVSEFSPEGKLFALIDSDGKLKIWNVEENELSREYVPNLHLSVPWTCLLWIETNSKVEERKNRNYDNQEIIHCIALGTSRGGVEVYSYSQNKVVNRLEGNGHAGAVTSICSYKNSRLYTSGEDCCIVEWSLSEPRALNAWSIGTEKPTCMVSLPMSDRLLIGCKELKLWSTITNQLEYTFTGHTSEVNSLKTLLVNYKNRDEEFVLSTAKNSREFSLWRVKAASKYKDARATFLMTHAPICVSCSIFGKKITIAAVTSTCVHLFFVEDIKDIPGEYKKPSKPKVTIELACDAEKTPYPIPIVTATLNFASQDANNILIGYGASPILSFETMKYDTYKQVVTLIREDPKKRIITQKKRKENSNTTVVISNDNDVEYQTGANRPLKRKNVGAKIEVPLENRLEVLSLSVDGPPGRSQVQLLKQALQNNDHALLRDVFKNKDENVIRLTLKALPRECINDLILELTMLMQKKSSNVQIAVCWLKILLQTRASELMALGPAELFCRFGQLIGIIEHRTNVLQPLLKLSGRLDMLMNQIKQNTDDDPINNDNVLVYEDKDSSDENDKESWDENKSGVRNGDENSTDQEDEEFDDEMEDDAMDDEDDEEMDQ